MPEQSLADIFSPDTTDVLWFGTLDSTLAYGPFEIEKSPMKNMEMQNKTNTKQLGIKHTM